MTSKGNGGNNGAAAAAAIERHPMRVGDPTPWGAADNVCRLADGVWLVSTPSHGRLYLQGPAKEAVPAAIRDTLTNGAEWAEEDLEIVLMLAALHQQGRVGEDAIWMTPEKLYAMAAHIAVQSPSYSAAAKVLRAPPPAAAEAAATS